MPFAVNDHLRSAVQPLMPRLTCSARPEVDARIFRPLETGFPCSKKGECGCGSGRATGWREPHPDGRKQRHGSWGSSATRRSAG